MSATTPTYPPQAVAAVNAAMTKYGITNQYVRTGILGTIGKETGFKLRPEVGYGKTSNERIRMIFGSRVADLSEAQLTALKSDNVAFFEKIYGYKTSTGRDLGNTQPGDGYKYRGRAFNGLTGRAQYKEYGDKMGIDLISNPDRLNEIPLAAENTILYFVKNFKNNENNGNVRSAVGVDKVSEIKNLDDGIKVAVMATGGWWHKDLSTGFRAENLKRATQAANTLLAESAFYSIDLIKRNPGKTIIGIMILGLIIGSVLYFTHK